MANSFAGHSERAEGYQAITRRVPVGPCSFITPFNFPLNLAAHKIGRPFASIQQYRLIGVCGPAEHNGQPHAIRRRRSYVQPDSAES